MRRMVLLWLIFGTATVLFCVGLVNSLPTDGEGFTRNSALTWILNLTKVLGIASSGFFGMYGLLHPYKYRSGELTPEGHPAQDGDITPQGRLAQTGILASVFLSAISFVLGEVRSADASAARQLQLLEDSANTQALLEGLTDVENKIVFAEASMTLHLDGKIGGKVLEHSDGMAYPLMTRAQLRDCFETFRLVEDLFSLLGTELDRADEAAFAGIVEHCLTEVPIPGFEIELPSTRVSFKHSPGDEEELGFFRIDPLNHTHSSRDPVGKLTAFESNGTDWEYNLDDIPVRYRSNKLVSVSDFAGVWLTVQLHPHNYVVVDDDIEVAASLEYLDMDTEDGRSLSLYAKDLELVGEDDYSVTYGFQFPELPDELAELFQTK